MHHFAEPGSPWFANFNADLSGTVQIGNLETKQRFEVDGRFLLQFLAHVVASERISAIERMTPNQLLGTDLPDGNAPPPHPEAWPATRDPAARGG